MSLFDRVVQAIIGRGEPNTFHPKHSNRCQTNNTAPAGLFERSERRRLERQYKDVAESLKLVTDVSPEPRLEVHSGIEVCLVECVSNVDRGQVQLQFTVTRSRSRRNGGSGPETNFYLLPAPGSNAHSPRFPTQRRDKLHLHPVRLISPR